MISSDQPSGEQPSTEQPSTDQRPVQDADPTREPDDATGAAADSGQVDEPAKKHGDPLLNEAEGRHGTGDLPDTGAGTAASGTA